MRSPPSSADRPSPQAPSTNTRRSRRSERRSPEAAAYRALYKTPAWRALRAEQLAKQPLCEPCARAGDVVAATVVNHRIPHRGDRALFFDPGNLQSVCQPHHDGLIQRQERLGFEIGCDTRGRPVDPQHPWNR